MDRAWRDLLVRHPRVAFCTGNTWLFELPPEPIAQPPKPDESPASTVAP